MSGNKRLLKEYGDLLNNANNAHIRDLLVNEQDLFNWKCTILPENEPYNNGAFRIEINFPAEYPFKPPKIKFLTQIYHPNIDEKGQICLPIIYAENWKPATKIDQVIQSLVALVNDPEPEHPLRSDLAEEYVKNRSKFNQKAEKHVVDFAEKR